MLKWMKAVLFLLVIAVNHLVTALVFFPWLSYSLIYVFILSSLCLLILPISDFVGLINRYDGLVLNSVYDLWLLWNPAVQLQSLFCGLYLILWLILWIRFLCCPLWFQVIFCLYLLRCLLSAFYFEKLVECSYIYIYIYIYIDFNSISTPLHRINWKDSIDEISSSVLGFDQFSDSSEVFFSNSARLMVFSSSNFFVIFW